MTRTVVLRIDVTWEPVPGKRNLSSYLRANAKLRALEVATRLAKIEAEQAYAALTGADLGYLNRQENRT